MAIFCTEMDTPIGRLWLATTDQGVCRIGLPGEPLNDLRAWLKRHVEPGLPREDAGQFAAAVLQLEEYFAGRRRIFDVPLDLRGTRFQVDVWRETAKIPYGSTISYGEVARRLGRSPGSARAVGTAMGANPVPIVVPCHRVVGADGSLTGYGGGLPIKEALLRLEGVRL